MDTQLENLMRQLGEAINESISSSAQVADVIARVRSGGYDVFVVLEATVGFNQRDEHAAVVPTPARPGESDPHFSAQDARFLKSLRISIEPVAGRDRDKSS
ncbi:MAG: hypothetical protein WA532_08120 [Candidatus Korobacteraceae bacterium]